MVLVVYIHVAVELTYFSTLALYRDYEVVPHMNISTAYFTVALILYSFFTFCVCCSSHKISHPSVSCILMHNMLARD